MNFVNEHILSICIFLPLISAVLISLLPASKTAMIKKFAFAASAATFLLSLVMYFGFKADTSCMQFAERMPWIKAPGISYFVGIDGISLLMILLTTFIFPVAVLSSFDYIKKSPKIYYSMLLFLETSVIGVFASLDVFLFYLFWEAMLIPMYFLIGIWGGERRIYAAIKFFIYTMAASLLMLVAILVIYFSHKAQFGFYSFNLLDLYKVSFLPKTAFFLFIAFALAFAVKIPLFPLHTWLPDAHVEAPAAASVILAGVLLKMGVYGFVRFLVPLFPSVSVNYAYLIAVVAVIGIIYGSLGAWSRNDIKQMVAYSSVAHMGTIMLGLMAFNKAAVSGAFIQMVNHGLSTGALFLLVGILYERRHSRLSADYGGIAKSVPQIAAVFMIIMLSSIGLPGLNGFVGEFLILFGSFSAYPILAALGVVGIILSAIYMLSMYQKVFFGKLENEKNKKMKDLKVREWIYLVPIILLIVWIGVYPNALLKKMDASVSSFIDSAVNKNSACVVIYQGRRE